MWRRVGVTWENRALKRQVHVQHMHQTDIQIEFLIWLLRRKKKKWNIRVTWKRQWQTNNYRLVIARTDLKLKLGAYLQFLSSKIIRVL